MKTKKLLLIALSVLACAALCAVLYFAFVSPPGENRLAGARFVKAARAYPTTGKKGRGKDGKTGMPMLLILPEI